jgi:hypothetical protein
VNDFDLDLPTYETLEEAEDVRDELVSQIQGIQAQLGSTGIREDGSGYRMSFPEWESWRRRAKDALRHKVAQLHEVKAWIRDYHAGQRGSDMRERVYADMSVDELSSAIHALTRELTQRARGE